MAAPFRLDGWTFSSSAFDVLGDVAGYNAHEARGRWARAGAEATERQSYVFSEAAIRGLFGPRGVEALLAADLAERVDDEPAGLRMLRMDGAIEWYEDIASKRRRAGQERARNAVRDERGRLVRSSTPSTPPAHAGVLDQQTASSTPASSSSPVPDLVTDLPDSPAPARVIALPARRSIGDLAWQRLNAMRCEIAEANGWTDVAHLHPMDPGRSELAARILECGPDAEQRVEHVLQIAFAEARAKNTVEYLSGSMFRADSWAKKLAMRVEDAKRPPRANPQSTKRGTGAIGSASPRSDFGDSSKPAKEAF